LKAFHYLIALLGVLAVSSGAAQDLELGEQIAQQGTTSGAAPCMSCHGEQGAGMEAGNFPRLAGLNGQYLAKQLRDYQNGTRNDPVMVGVASALNDEEIEAVAAYYAAQEAFLPPAQVDAEQAERGRILAQEGNWSSYTPPCASCHGPEGIGVGEAFPAIAGQPVGYTIEQFAAWRSGERQNDPQGMMEAVAKRLTDEEIAAVAAYYVNLGRSENGGE